MDRRFIRKSYLLGSTMLRLGEKRMLRKFIALGLVGLFLVMSLVVAEDSIGPYNSMADVNKDGIVDIMDLVEVGQAYGSNYTLAHQTNKTTITVLSYKNGNFSYVENALVAVFPPPDEFARMEGPWNYTNSSGTVAFDLNANSSYVAIAWDSDRSRYNYANVTTNLLGEASVTIWLSYYSSSAIRSIPRGWIVFTVFDNRTGELFKDSAPSGRLEAIARTFTACPWANPEFVWNYDDDWFGATQEGGFAVDSSKCLDSPFSKPNTNVAISFWYRTGIVGNCTFRTDEYGGAYVVATIYL